MLTIKIPVWVPIGGLTHTATSYQVATDVNFTNIIDNHLDDTVNLSVYYSPVIVPANTTYYVRVNRKFSDGSTSGWGDIMPAVSDSANGGVITYQPIIVHRPIVSVDSATLMDQTSTTYTISTSKFVGVNEAHGYTIWMVTDDQNKVIEYSKSTTNLTSITLTKKPNMLLGTKYLRFTAIHGTLTKIESPIGEFVQDLSLADFIISIPNTIQSAGINVDVSISYPAGGTNNTINNIELRDTNDNVLWTTSVAANATSIVIPGGLLIEGTQYLIVATGPNDVSGIAVHKTIPLNIARAYNVLSIDYGFIYRQTIDTLKYGRYPGISNITTEELTSGKTLAVSNGNVYNTDINPDRTFTIGNIPYNGLSGGDGLSLLRTMHNIGVVHNVINTTTYAKAVHLDIANNSIQYITSVMANDDHVLDRNAVVIIADKVYTYSTSNGLEEHTITTAGVVSSKSLTLPNGVTDIATIAVGSGNSLLVVPVGGTTIESYDIATNTYSTIYTLPTVFRNRTLKQSRLINGDVLIWKPIRSEVVNGSTVTDTDLDMLYIDNRLGTATHIVPITNRTYDLQGSILRDSGELLLITDAANGANVLAFE